MKRAWVAFALLLAGCPESVSSVAPTADASVGVDVGLQVVDMAAACEPTDEVCNGVDDDCDGLVDADDPDLRRMLAADPENCGACGVACDLPNAEAECRSGNCLVALCEPGFNDVNGLAADGCESDCLVTEGGREVCDGVDNDCDDEVDEGFDLRTDLANCGACGEVCATPPGGRTECVEGRCALTGCDGGYHDLDGDAANGCEYACSPRSTEEVREFCNGRDDDCDGETDEAEDLVIPAGFCGDRGVCAPERPALCMGEAGLVCERPDNFQAGNEVGLCDGHDNDCDGRIDEDYAAQLRNDAGPITCEAGVGACRQTAEARCADDGASVVCEAVPLLPPTDVDDDCDGVDDDCDGRVDEDFEDAWVERPGYAIFAFEASRQGSDGARACSQRGAEPWTNLDLAGARAACAEAGARLCTDGEWTAACSAGGAFPYGDEYDPEACNGGEHDVDPEAPGLQDGPLPTGEMEGCEAGGVFDLSGNVKEWTEDEVEGLHPVRGGGYDSNVPAGLTCEQRGDLRPSEFRGRNLGFRCCSDL